MKENAIAETEKGLAEIEKDIAGIETEIDVEAGIEIDVVAETVIVTVKKEKNTGVDEDQYRLIT